MAGTISRSEELHSSMDSVNPSSLSEGHRDTLEVLPVTKVPALDTIDSYAVDRSSVVATAQSPSIELSASCDSQTLANTLVQGYARFVSRFTGLEEVAFVVSRHSSFVAGSESSRGVVCASVTGSQCATRELPYTHHSTQETQFSLQLGLEEAGPENGEPSDAHDESFVLFVQQNEGRLSVSFAYPQRLIPDAAVQQLLTTLVSLLVDSSNSFLSTETQKSPDLSIINFPSLMTPPPRPDDSQQDIERKSSQPSLLHAAFEGWAQRRPNTIALDFVHSLASSSSPAEHSTLTYAALDVAASNLAVHMRALLSTGSTAGRIIPVYMSTSPELYISYLAILKAGFAFSPIPQDAPEQRVREILQDIGCPIILGNVPEPSSGPWYPADNEQVKSTWVNVPEVTRWREMSGDNGASPASVANGSLEAPEISDDQVAYLLFTSGSTGKPKGVQVSHLAGTCSIESHSTAIPLPGKFAGNFRWFQFASPTFDPSLMEIFVTLSSGATLCSADRSLTLTDLEATINEARATVMMATPSLAALLRPSRLTTLESLWTMGEKLNRTVIENFSKNPATADQPSRMLVNAYGPTEGAINCTFLAPVEFSVRGSIIGEALPTCSMFVLDPEVHEPKAVPAGLAGELAIGGPQVSKGYLNRPTETAKAFVHSPEFGTVYRTGDMARIVWDESGRQVIEFLGRITSDQVKISGRRLELGEIESVLATVAGVTEVVAVVSKRDPQTQGSEQIVACLVSSDKDERQRIAREANENTHEHLSSYMCPTTYAFFDYLPRSSSGKIDRKAISAKLLQGAGSGIEFVAPPKVTVSNGIQEEWEPTDDANVVALQELVVRLLAETTDEEISTISPGANLYSLGVDSLGAMRFLQKLRDSAIEGLSVGDVLQAETPKGLVSMIANRHLSQANGSQLEEVLQQNLAAFGDRNLATCAERLGYNSSQISKVLPTTATQSGMLTSFLRSSADKSFAACSYIYHTVISLEADVDVERLKNAWNVVTGSYDSFRTVFCWLDDDMAPFAQCILAPEAISELQWNMYSGSSEETFQSALRHAEDTIELSRPTWAISMISAPEKTTLILSMFHGIFDGGSLALLLEDVSSVYDGKPIAQRTSLDHIVKHHFQADHATTAQFWQQHLDQYSPVAFPSVIPHRPSSIKSTDSIEITARTTYDDLKRQSKKMGSTPLSVLQAAWGSILLAYTGTPDQDVVMGSVVSGRLDTESEACIGPTFTTVPIRLGLNQIAKETEGAWSNKSVARHLTSFNAKTLSHLQPRLGSLVTADGKLPYDTLIAYQDFNAGSSDSKIWSSIEHPPMANDFVVMIEVWPGADSSLTLRASYNHAQLDRDAAEMMLQELSEIVAYILDQPDEDFQNASSNTNADLKSSLNTNPQFAPEVAEGALIHSKFEEHAQSHPDDVALVFKGDIDNEDSPLNIEWTYAELDARADALAERLVQTYGYFTNSAVPICIEKSPALYVAILGIVKAGGAWCPIDTFSPAQRRHDLVVRTASKVLLISSADASQPAEAIPVDVEVVDVNQFAGIMPNGLPKTQRDLSKNPASPDDMAYLIWTSGTTGAPKGVPIKHSGAVSSMKSLAKDIPTDVPGGVIRCMQFSQYTFDVSIQDIFYTWSLGGVLISATREIMLGSFAKLSNITNATHAHLTPAFSAGVPRQQCKTLKVITMIGEKLTPAVADDWGTDMRAFNTYGPAEATIVSTVREFGNECKNIKSANIGWPLETLSVFVTRNKKMVMKNAVGELALGGPQLSPGYLNQEDVTKAKYVWSDEANQVLYYTGDLVRMLADGSLEYINRVDDLVKLGGIRVELSEISYSLGECHSMVENIETQIINRPDRPTKVVVAFLAAPEAPSSDNEELLLLNDTAVEIARAASDKAHTVLPDHMIPSVYLVVKNIPRTQSAKTDRRALQAAYASFDIEDWERKMNPDNGTFDDAEDADAATATKVVETIATLANISTSIISKVSRLGSLGIDSIHAIRLASRLNEAGYQLSVVEVLNCVTVNDLVKLASTASGANKNTDVFDLESFNDHWHAATAEKVQEVFFTARATTLQESLLSETMGTSNLYWSNHFMALDKSVDLDRLRQAWIAVCQKTEALRTGFIPVAEVDDGQSQDTLDFSLLQLIYDVPDVDWKYSECTKESWRDELDIRNKDTFARQQGTYFRYPPWAVTILDQGEERIMVLTIHHSIYDGPSLNLIMDDVRSAYTYKAPTRHQLRDALSIILPTEKRVEETRSFWKTELAKFADLDAPVWPDLTGIRLPPGTQPDHSFIAEEIMLTEPVTKLQAAASELGLSSIASIIRAAWCCVSLTYLGAPGTVFAETLSDRVLHADLEDGVGPLLSVVPIPFHPQGTVRDVLSEQHRLSVQSWKHRHVHAREVRKMLKRPRGEALYPGLFNFHAASEDSDASSGPSLWTEMEDDIGLQVEHPMALNVFQKKSGALVVEASSDASVLSREQLVMFTRQIDALVSAMVAHPEEQIVNLVNHLPSDLLSISKQDVSAGVLESVNVSPTYYLELYAREHPEWIAVETASAISEHGIEKESMTFGKLNAEANRVAAFITSFGYRNRMIAVCLGRHIPSYPIIAGVFKSGNTYLPIDDNLPNDRKAFLIEDGDCPLVFTETAFSATFSDVPDSCRVLCLDEPELPASLAAMPTEDRDYPAEPEDISYLLYTSGSTGKPKGVMITRANLSSFIESLSEFTCRVAPDTLKLGGTGRYLAQASRAFDVHLVEMFMPWRHGMATVTAARTMILDDLRLTLSKWDITHASFVPSLVDQSNILPEHCPKLKYISVGGEKISKRVLETWAGAPGVAFVNAYGPTEVTIGCTFALIDKTTTIRNIGAPLTACVGHVLLPGTLTYALRGQTGELCFTGDLVGKGYLNRPDATGFCKGPNGEKMYRTGDVGRLMVDDTVEYLGRGDDQTKIRGQRMELGEVSEVLRSSSTIGIDVVTTVAKHPGLSRMQLISFIARADARQREQGNDVMFMHSDFATLGKELQDACKRKLPGYMVPEIVLPITSIPLAPMSGKANVKQLQGLFSDLPLATVLQGNNAVSQDSALAKRPMTADEEAVVKEICSVVSTDPSIMGPLTNIFEVGVDSLSAISLSVKLRNIGYDVTVALVMSNPVVEQLARLTRTSSSPKAQAAEAQLRGKLSEMQTQFHQNPPHGVDPSSVASVRPCLPLQEGLVARSINNEGAQLYINHIALQLNESVDAERIRSAWTSAVADNEILRTFFAPLGNEIVQAVVAADSHKIQWVEEEYTSAEGSIEKHNAQKEDIARDIIANISAVPPIRFQLTRSSDTKKPLVLFISVHHSLYDGESFFMLIEEVAARYAGEPVAERGSPSAFIEHVYSQDLEKAKDHWVQSLADCHPTTFRADSRDMESPKTVHKQLGSKLSDLERRAANLQTTLPSLVQAVFALLLADTVDASDVTYGIVLSGRAVSVAGAESVLLPCITTVPGRLNANGLSTVNDVVGAIQKSTVRTLEFQHTSLRHIQRWVNSETPLFDCLFSYIRSTESGKHGFWQELDMDMPSDYPFAIEVEANNSLDKIQLNCVATHAFSRSYNAEEFLEKMDAVLSSIASGEEVSLDNFNLSLSKAPGSSSKSIQWDETTWSATESKIQELVATFCNLDLTTVSKGASFLSLGIDSVTAIQFARRLRDLGFTASSADVMRFSCVGALSKHFDELSSEPAKESADKQTFTISVDAHKSKIPLLSPHDSISSIFQCTPLQSAMITQTVGSDGQVYTHPHPVRLSPSVDIPRLGDALSKVIQDNDILRTTFHSIEELGFSWVGAVHTNPPFAWKEITIPSGVDILSEISAGLLLDEESAFEIPPLRTFLINQGEAKFLVVIMHHSLYDGASLPFVFEDLALAYQGSELTKRSQFSDTVHHVLEGQEQACAFWTDKLMGYEIAEIPPHSTTVSAEKMFLSEHRVDLDISKVVETCKSMEVTVQSVSLLAYAKILARLIGKRDVVFGQVLAGRSLPTPGAERTIGPLFNTVAQRVTFEPKFLSNRAMALRLQQLTADAQVHQHAPLRMVQNSLRQLDGLKAASLFDTLFVFQKSADLDAGVLGNQEIWTPYEADDYAAEAEHKLNIEVDHARDGIVVRASCKGQYFPQHILDSILQDFGSAFRDIIEHPTRCATVVPDRLGELPLRLSVASSEESTVEELSDAPAHESIVRDVLAELAGVSLDNIKPNTSIFNIGLDSLSAIRIAATCRSKGLKAGVADVLQGNTLRGISLRIKSTSENKVQPKGALIPNYQSVETTVLEKLGVEKGSIETILPCLSGQMYHLASWLKTGRKLFEPAWPYVTTERIDAERLEDAWFRLCKRHPTLRTCFAVISPSEAVQVVMKEANRTTDTFKVIHSSEPIVEAAQAQAKEEALRPSSLLTPPVRLRLIKASDRDGMLVLINHAAYDAWSMPMFVSDLANFYRGENSAFNPDFPGFVDYSVRSLRELDEQAYWTSAVGSSAPTLIKGRDPNRLSQLFYGAWEMVKSLVVSSPTEDGSESPSQQQLFYGAWEKVKNLSKMEATCRSAGVGLQTMVLLAVSRCLARKTGVDSPTMGLYQTGRSASFSEIERLSGPCLNVTPLTVSSPITDDGETASTMLDKARSIQTSLAERVMYEQSSIRDILTRWASTKGTQSPLFNTWVNLLWMQQGQAAEGAPRELFEPLKIGVPTDFIPSEPLADAEGKLTSVADLDTSYVPNQNVYIDIGPDPKTDSIGFGVRVEGGLLAEDEVDSLVTDIGLEIEAIVASLA
ncbi:hypothetical protein ASPWEDRAFT_39793 [Aspergillus wentii DTO 134E9]|uniref:Nonribosomal peptide synthetase sidC n=1 Tax=Aspergillus wentii DTO 134E9 TaxID=1073089 RepID=A0A1L9RIH1_ASPWE|nr:uncharacterized protein ASPWEDRAFT_39793 [Aspergillus wentii DTO 134E9]OJJ34714.1 hypothetical protein ASPWEDRAFT_39793 [Aspergillus wentii DTO 134E9]